MHVLKIIPTLSSGYTKIPAVPIQKSLQMEKKTEGDEDKKQPPNKLPTERYTTLF